MRNRIVSCVVCFLFFVFSISFASADQLAVYTSVKESMIETLRQAFIKKYPDITINYRIESIEYLIELIQDERKTGKISADIIWTSQPINVFELYEEGALSQYSSPELSKIKFVFRGYEGFINASRLDFIGIAYNTSSGTPAPANWQDLTTPTYKDKICIPDPATVGTGFWAVTVLSKELGWDFFKKLQANGLVIKKSSLHSLAAVINSESKASFMFDYNTMNARVQGKPVNFALPPEKIVVPSAIAIIKDSPNMPAAQKFIDFMLSQEGQTIIANVGSIPVRDDVALPSGFALPSLDEAVQEAMKLDLQQIRKNKDITLQNFYNIMNQSPSEQVK